MERHHAELQDLPASVLRVLELMLEYWAEPAWEEKRVDVRKFARMAHTTEADAATWLNKLSDRGLLRPSTTGRHGTWFVISPLEVRDRP